jgi:hypothetical protein
MSLKVCKPCRTRSGCSEDGGMCETIFLGSLAFFMLTFCRSRLVKLKSLTFNVSWMMIMVGAFSNFVATSMSTWVLNFN